MSDQHYLALEPSIATGGASSLEESATSAPTTVLPGQLKPGACTRMSWIFLDLKLEIPATRRKRLLNRFNCRNLSLNERSFYYSCRSRTPQLYSCRCSRNCINPPSITSRTSRSFEAHGRVVDGHIYVYTYVWTDTKWTDTSRCISLHRKLKSFRRLWMNYIHVTLYEYYKLT